MLEPSLTLRVDDRRVHAPRAASRVAKRFIVSAGSVPSPSGMHGCQRIAQRSPSASLRRRSGCPRLASPFPRRSRMGCLGTPWSAPPPGPMTPSAGPPESHDTAVRRRGRAALSTRESDHRAVSRHVVFFHERANPGGCGAAWRAKSHARCTPHNAWYHHVPGDRRRAARDASDWKWLPHPP
jgi:hypothetical protein